ncbi:hypothetical protein KL86DES1_21950 [uncultured Desulfovibrio sp.]|uniref:Uncharacterized protein n=1 Tax=uncultured Desulfovibrio sp. TaxID=167968 RepID=A0A212LA62_9BACT|nr:hypothetical protein KL86DES1_21950 [uncultured Desulfovibrio sp.]VZH34843.1 conserved protein of unknown function [Desulfovibrio sp. 86]
MSPCPLWTPRCRRRYSTCCATCRNTLARPTFSFRTTFPWWAFCAGVSWSCIWGRWWRKLQRSSFFPARPTPTRKRSWPPCPRAKAGAILPRRWKANCQALWTRRLAAAFTPVAQRRRIFAAVRLRPGRSAPRIGGHAAGLPDTRRAGRSKRGLKKPFFLFFHRMKSRLSDMPESRRYFYRAGLATGFKADKIYAGMMPGEYCLWPLQIRKPFVSYVTTIRVLGGGGVGEETLLQKGPSPTKYF